MERRRIAGACGLAAFAIFNVGWIAGDLVQRPAFDAARDDISDLGAITAVAPWLYDRIAANLGGLLLVALGVGIWRVARLGGAALVVTGVGMFLDGIFRLDCQGIDVGCHNDSWHAHAHKIESGVTVGATFVALVALGIVLRRWPLLLAVPAVFAANVVFSIFGAGAATRAGTVVVFAAFAYLGWCLMTIPTSSLARPRFRSP